MDRKEIALELRKNGFNCAQSVAVAFSNVLGCEAIHTFKMAEPFGFGMGDGESQCGCLSAIAMMVGMKKSDGDIENPRTKRQSYTMISAIKNEFKDKVGDTICKNIKGGEVSCEECILLSCELLDKYLLGIYPDGEEPDIKVIRNRDAKF